LKASIETGIAQIQAAHDAIMQLTEQGEKSKEAVAEAKVNKQSPSTFIMISFRDSSGLFFTFLHEVWAHFEVSVNRCCSCDVMEMFTQHIS
jgi:hypothetical protein